jgi:hypothetical protein
MFKILENLDCFEIVLRNMTEIPHYVMILFQNSPLDIFRTTWFNRKHRYLFYSINPYSTLILIPSEWAENSGAYMLCTVVIPFEKSPFCVAFSLYTNT